MAPSTPQVTVCMIFLFHRPYSLRKTRIFDVGNIKQYFNEQNSRRAQVDAIKRSKRLYIPFLDLLSSMEHEMPISYSFSLSGVFLDQCLANFPQLLSSLREITSSSSVEILGEAYYRSLAALYSPREFIQQIILHREKIQKLFNKEPEVFLDSDSLLNNAIGQVLKMLGFSGVVSRCTPEVLLKQGLVSKMKPVRISSKEKSYVKESSFRPTPGKVIKMVNADTILSSNSLPDRSDSITNVIQKGEKEIFTILFDADSFSKSKRLAKKGLLYLRTIVKSAIDNNARFMTPSEIVKRTPAVGTVNIKKNSGAELIENEMQKSTSKEIYKLENLVKQKLSDEDAGMYKRYLEIWRRLQGVDHFKDMSTSNRYSKNNTTPYEFYINYKNILTDFVQKLRIYKQQLK